MVKVQIKYLRLAHKPWVRVAKLYHSYFLVHLISEQKFLMQFFNFLDEENSRRQKHAISVAEEAYVASSLRSTQTCSRTKILVDCAATLYPAYLKKLDASNADQLVDEMKQQRAGAVTRWEDLLSEGETVLVGKALEELQCKMQSLYYSITQLTANFNKLAGWFIHLLR